MGISSVAPSRPSVSNPVGVAILRRIAPYVGSAALVFLLTQAVQVGGNTPTALNSRRVRTHSRRITAHEKIVIKGGSLVETTTVTVDSLITKE